MGTMELPAVALLVRNILPVSLLQQSNFEPTLFPGTLLMVLSGRKDTEYTAVHKVLSNAPSQNKTKHLSGF